MSVEHDFQWFLQHEEAYSSLTIDQVHALGRGELVPYGETEAKATDSSGSPAAADDESTKAADAAAATAKAAEEEAARLKAEETAKATEQPVVLAKDGKNVIPFSELEAARAKVTELENLNREKDTILAELKAAKVADEKVGTTEAQDAIFVAMKEAYPELADVQIPIFKKMLEIAEAGSKAELATLKQELETLKATLDPIKQSTEDASRDAHFDTITEAIPDFYAMVTSREIHRYVAGIVDDAQRAKAEAVMADGEAKDVIELFNACKAARPVEQIKSPADSKEEIARKAADAIAKAKTTSVTSLTDIPASSGTEANEEPTTVEGWSKKFASMSPAEIRKACGLSA